MWRAVLAACCLTMASSVLAEESRYALAQGDRVEYQSHADRAVWDLQGWYGGDLHKLWWKIEGDDEAATNNELQLLYSRAVSAYFDAQFGLRVEDDGTGSESSLVLGIQGLAPYNIEIDAAAFITEDGEVEIRGEIERDFRLTQRLVLQPRIELNASSAINDDAALEMRLRYEINRQFAPYAGFSWQHDFDGRVADKTTTSFVAGVRFWF